MPEIPRLLEPQQLLDLLPRPDILVIDLSNEETYRFESSDFRLFVDELADSDQTK